MLASLALSLALALLPGTSHVQAGTVNVSSSSTSASVTGGLWRNMILHSEYLAWSNDSNAAFTFTFEGTRIAYRAGAKYDRGNQSLTLARADGGKGAVYYVDLYEDRSVPTADYLETKWTSPWLASGRYTVTLAQIGPDPRLGFYPYLLVANWEVTTPNVDNAPFTSNTGTTTSDSPSAPTTVPTRSTKSAPLVIILPVVLGGTAVAAALLGFLFFCRRRSHYRRAQTVTTPTYMPAHELPITSPLPSFIRESNNNGNTLGRAQSYRYSTINMDAELVDGIKSSQPGATPRLEPNDVEPQKYSYVESAESSYDPHAALAHPNEFGNRDPFANSSTQASYSARSPIRTSVSALSPPVELFRYSDASISSAYPASVSAALLTPGYDSEPPPPRVTSMAWAPVDRLSREGRWSGSSSDMYAPRTETHDGGARRSMSQGEPSGY